VVGEAGGARRQARRTRLRLALAAAAALTAWACASAGDPPGGPPDTTPPRLLRVEPESGAVLTAAPRSAVLYFDEVVSERIVAPQPDISGAVILSPATDRVSVDWHRTRLTVTPRGGFRPGRIYHLQLLPVIADLRNNRMRVGRTIVFSTGPEIPAATLSGAVVDWAGGRPAAGALIEAVLLPDSLPYRALADSTGSFRLEQMPPGPYVVYGVLDQNGNRRRDPREAFDTSRVTLADSSSVELYAFTHDTLGPRIRTADLVDSTTIRLVFDRPLDPSQPVDTSMVRVAPAADTTQALPLLRVFTPAAFDSARKAEAAARDSITRAEAAARAARDTTHRRPAQPAPGAPAAAPAPAPPPLAPAPGTPPRDSTRAMKMLARRPAPTDTRVLRLAAPLAAGARYVVTVERVLGLAGATGHGRAQLAVPVPPPPRRDTLPAPTRKG
jgi:hypothetical protein